MTTGAARRAETLQTAIADADAMAALHGAQGNGLCRCLRPISTPAGCAVANRVELYREHLRTRAAYVESVDGPTMLLCHVQPPTN